jgi:hypothetical protein
LRPVKEKVKNTYIHTRNLFEGKPEPLKKSVKKQKIHSCHDLPVVSAKGKVQQRHGFVFYAFLGWHNYSVVVF